MAAIATGVSLAQYLKTSYHPDVEYIDGELKEKPMPTILHGIVQMILGEWFRAHREQWKIVVAGDTRTKVDEDRVRLPDVTVIRRGGGELGLLTQAPIVAIEILSPSDSYSDLCQRARDLRAMGTENIWLINPERHSAEVWNGESWQLEHSSTLQALHAPIFVDLDWLWLELNKEIEYTRA